MVIGNMNTDQKRAFHSTTTSCNLYGGQKTSLKMSGRLDRYTRTGRTTDRQTDWQTDLKTKQRTRPNTTKSYQKRYSLLVVNVIHKVIKEAQNAALCEVAEAKNLRVWLTKRRVRLGAHYIRARARI